jgi:hypothetical protein
VQGVRINYVPLLNSESWVLVSDSLLQAGGVIMEAIDILGIYNMGSQKTIVNYCAYCGLRTQ